MWKPFQLEIILLNVLSPDGKMLASGAKLAFLSPERSYLQRLINLAGLNPESILGMPVGPASRSANHLAALPLAIGPGAQHTQTLKQHTQRS